MTDDATPSTPDLPPADLLQVAQETEQHVAAGGWAQRERVFALVPTADLVAAEPSLAEALSGAGRYSSIEQELPEGVDLAEYLGQLAWPRSVTGCALAVERLRAAPGAGGGGGVAGGAGVGPDSGFAGADQEVEPVRLLVVATRDGERFTLVRLAAHDSDDAVAVGPAVGTDLQEALAATLEG
ncbi:PPA1309 family protein [Kytococcus sedentarius]|uniref:PPA1309 family protein n=1 Tax=Kytococcus sedentarius TaxID=1276 RepID=UPI0035BBBCA9